MRTWIAFLLGFAAGFFAHASGLLRGLIGG